MATNPTTNPMGTVRYNDNGFYTVLNKNTGQWEKEYMNPLRDPTLGAAGTNEGTVEDANGMMVRMTGTTPGWTESITESQYNADPTKFAGWTPRQGFSVTPQMLGASEPGIMGMIGDALNAAPIALLAPALGAVSGWAGGAAGAGVGGGAEALAGGAFDMGGMGAGFGSYASPALGAGAEAFSVGGGNPFAYTPTNPYSLGFDPGAFTASQLPGGSLSGAIPAGAGGVAGNPFGMVDLGGAGAIPGAGSGVGVGLNLSNLPTGAGGGGGGTGTGTGTNTQGSGGTAGAMSRILNGTATSADYLSVLGTAGATALGLYGSNQQANSLQDLAAQYQNFGAPSRGRFEASMSPGFDPNSIPGYAGALDSASKSILAKLSASGGNPFGNPSGLIEANKAIVSGTALPAIQEYQRMNANTGFGNSMNAAMNLQTQGIGADANSLNALGYGINALTNPQPSLADLLKQIQGLGGSKNGLP